MRDGFAGLLDDPHRPSPELRIKATPRGSCHDQTSLGSVSTLRGEAHTSNPVTLAQATTWTDATTTVNLAQGDNPLKITLTQASGTLGIDYIEITAQTAGAAAQRAETNSVQTADSGPEVCTSKAAAVSFTTPGTPPPDQLEDVRHLTLGKDNFVIKTAKTDPTACNGTPCTVEDTSAMRIGGTGADKTATVVGFKLNELPDGAAVSEGILKLGTPTCPAGACPADAVITATPLKSPVTGDSKGSDLATDADTSTTPYSLPLGDPRADIAGSEYQWLLLTSNTEEVLTFGEATAAEQPSLAVTYLPAGPPGKVLNLSAAGGDASAMASWGLPESNGSVALLDGYDVEVVDDGGTVVKTLEVKDPYAAISGLANNVTYTIRVRAKTAYGHSEWEAATATTKPVPPPASSETSCVLEASPGVAATASTESGRQAYIDRVKHYFQAQDAVLEGRAATIWDAPGVTPDASNTAKLSLLNAALVADRERLEAAGVVRSNSAVTLDDVVVQTENNGAVQVTAKVTWTWEETPEEQTTGSASGSARATAGTTGQVEPSEPSISIFVFDWCGGLTIIDVTGDAGEDSTDFLDPCGGLIPGDSVRAAAAAEDGTEIICTGANHADRPESSVPGKYETFSCHCVWSEFNAREGSTCTMKMATRPVWVMKGIKVYAGGSLGWTINRQSSPFYREWLNIHTFHAYAKVVTESTLDVEKLLTRDPAFKARFRYVLKNLQLQPESTAWFTAIGASVSYDVTGGSISPGASDNAMTSKEEMGPKGRRFWRDPGGTGENSFTAECTSALLVCSFRDARLRVVGILHLDKYVTGPLKSSGSTPWKVVGPAPIVP
ncbi:fibronectin type III domain-containing protein [Nonomuraea sp. NBC_00507]|uniref:fibronectin type III domain-containing protein n=1 Tax=Nonomuraea sp. NBC_00507 TaxID=2976002 RepID=UPI002E19778B